MKNEIIKEEKSKPGVYLLVGLITGKVTTIVYLF
jgi:hypothetical protein